MKNIIACIFLLLLTTQAHARKYVYASHAVPENYHQGKDSLTVDMQLKSVYADHGIQRLNVCGVDAPYYCIYTTSMNFSVPKKKVAVGDSWISGGGTFKVVRTETLEFLGKKVPTFVITSRFNEQREDYFYYSDRLGLIGIKFGEFEDYPVRFLLLTQHKGFPR